MMRRRVGRPGLLGTAARTAVVAGTATAVSGGVRRRQANREAEEQQAAYEQQQREMQAQQSMMDQAAPPAAAPTVDRMARLKELAEMRDAGILTEQEFAAEKAKILNS